MIFSKSQQKTINVMLFDLNFIALPKIMATDVGRFMYIPAHYH